MIIVNFVSVEEKKTYIYGPNSAFDFFTNIMIK